MPKHSLIKKYNRLNSQYQNISKAPLVSDVFIALLVSIAYIIFKRAFPALSQDILTITSLIALLIFLIVMRFKKSLALGGTVFLLLMGVVILIFGQKPAPRGGAYIIIDLSENMKEELAFPDISVSKLISLSVAQVPDNIDAGLMLSGGIFMTDAPCFRVEEIQTISPKSSINLSEIQARLSYLDGIEPQGPSNITYAISEAIMKLSGRTDVQEIIVVTSGIDNQCGPLDINLLHTVAEKYQVEYTLTIFLIGEQQNSVIDNYKLVADRIEPLTLVEQVPASISTIVSEPIFSYYSP